MKRLPLLLLCAMAAPALAQPVGTPFGGCTGGVSDCVTATGHASLSFATTLSINEQRAVSFGSISVTTGGGPSAGDASIDLDINGGRTAHDGATDHIVLLGGTGASQSPGHYTVQGADEGASTQVYISFADNGGNPVDFSGENYHPGSSIMLIGPGGTFTMDGFVINESGSDVYGHYIDNRGGGFTPAPGIGSPYDASRTPSASAIDVVVGATLHTAAGQTYSAGKYIGTFSITVSY